MKAVATKDFSASLGGRVFACKAGDELEADARTIERLCDMGLAAKEPKRRRKAARND